ncbi:urease accessory protein UreF [Kouleothrix sp.]|uniref:urease accessory protein UreF n=1 Tax=Kouleothrix sp. TaxID=2779161 RepID=UPI00391C05E7
MIANSAAPLAATSLLAALQLADSFFPSGLYTQSHGMEAFVSAGVAGPAQVAPLLASYLRHTAGPADGLAARWAVRAAHANDIGLVAAIDARLDAGKLAAEPRAASRRCGGRVLLLGRELYPSPLLAEYAALVAAGRAPGHQALALALLGAAAGLDEDTAALIELHTFAVSLLGAALRLGAIDHADAQALLLGAQPAIAAAADAHRHSHWHDIGGFAPQIDVQQFRHRYAEMHMFAS